MIPEEGVGNPGQVGFISLVAVHQEAEKMGAAQDPWKGRLKIPEGRLKNPEGSAQDP